jgi:hypothetical protein
VCVIAAADKAAGALQAYLGVEGNKDRLVSKPLIFNYLFFGLRKCRI